MCTVWSCGECYHCGDNLFSPQGITLRLHKWRVSICYYITLSLAIIPARSSCPVVTILARHWMTRFTGRVAHQPVCGRVFVRHSLCVYIGIQFLCLFRNAVVLTLWRPLLPYGYSYETFCARTDWAVICNFWHPGTLTLGPERQSVHMSKITNDGTGCFIDEPIWQQWASKG